MGKKATKTRAKNLVTEMFGFQSNEDRKLEQRMRYKSEYKGKVSRWMGSGVVPPKKGGHGRTM